MKKEFCYLWYCRREAVSHIELNIEGPHIVGILYCKKHKKKILSGNIIINFLRKNNYTLLENAVWVPKE